MAKGHIEDGKITLSWNLPRLLLPKNRVKLLLNMLVIAQQTIPRGGTLTIDPVGEGETMRFRVTAAGPECARAAKYRCAAPAPAPRRSMRMRSQPYLYAAAGAGLRIDRDASRPRAKRW